MLQRAAQLSAKAVEWSSNESAVGRVLAGSRLVETAQCHGGRWAVVDISS